MEWGGGQKDHLRLQNWITCVSGSLASPRVHLRLRFWITCTSKLPGASDIIHHVCERFLSLMLTVARDPNVEVQAIQIWRYKRSKFGVKPYAHSSHLGFIGVEGGTFYLHHPL